MIIAGKDRPHHAVPPSDGVRNLLRESKGSAMLESAVVLPTFCLLLFGIFEFALVLTGYCSATFAVRQGARFASLRSSTSLAVTGAGGSPLTASAQAASITNSVTQVLYTPGASTPSITLAYLNPLGASQTGNYVGNEVMITVSWTQAIRLVGYQKNLAISISGARLIMR